MAPSLARFLSTSQKHMLPSSMSRELTFPHCGVLCQSVTKQTMTTSEWPALSVWGGWGGEYSQQASGPAEKMKAMGLELCLRVEAERW